MKFMKLQSLLKNFKQWCIDYDKNNNPTLEKSLACFKGGVRILLVTQTITFRESEEYLKSFLNSIKEEFDGKSQKE